MADLIDTIHFAELAGLDPPDVCRRASCAYDEATGCYRLSVWGDEYAVFPAQRRIACMGDDHRRPHDFFHLFLVHYLLHAREIDPAEAWISEKDIPGGATFFRGPHAIPTQSITRRFANDLNGFKKGCERLGGIPLNMADAGYRFRITPRIPAAVLYWIGDDDFPAESRILFDRTIALHLASDVVYALAVGICDRLAHPGSDKAG